MATGADKPTTGQKSVGLAAIGVLIAPLTVAIGSLAVSGPLGRVQRNEPVLFVIALVVLVVGSALWFLTSLPKNPKFWQVVAVVFVILGYGGALAVAVLTADNQPRPRIAATLNNERTKITGTITAASMATDDRLAIFIEALARNEPGSEEEFSVDERLYRAFIGPDEDGKVEQSITMPLRRKGVTDIRIKAFTGTDSPVCDPLAPPAGSEARRQEGEEKAAKQSRDESGTSCAIISLLPRRPPGRG